MTKEEIKDMNNSTLISTLDDIVQFDLLQLSNSDWLTLLEEHKEYNQVMYELRRRLEKRQWGLQSSPFFTLGEKTLTTGY